MKNSPLKSWVRWLLVLCSITLVYVLFIPMWRIDLEAPQYPEGLQLLIYPNHIGGSVDIINGLNHYIGMKTLHTEDFIEFKILPILIGVFAALFLLTAILNKEKWMRWLLGLYIAFGVVAIADFWRWEYDYGHNLDPNAAIIVPGMAYQPPLIGFKQLLNFGAYSMPDLGGILFFGVGVVLLLAVLLTYKRNKLPMGKNIATMAILFGFGMIFQGCKQGSEPIKYGKDNCYYCKMTISDPHFGAEIITHKGKVFKFDDLGCMLNNVSDASFDKTTIANYFVTDYCGDHNLLDASKCFILKSDAFKSPMGSNMIGVENKDSLNAFKTRLLAEQLNWPKILN